MENLIKHIGKKAQNRPLKKWGMTRKIKTMGKGLKKPFFLVLFLT